MDGVLIDSEPLHKRAKELDFAEMGIVLPESVYDSYKGQPDATMLPEVLIARGFSTERIQELSRRKKQIYEEIEHELQAVDGAAEFVAWAASSYKIALATSATPRNREASLNTRHRRSVSLRGGCGRPSAAEARPGSVPDRVGEVAVACSRLLDRRGFCKWIASGEGCRVLLGCNYNYI